jgi:hypothetical protein
MMEVHLTVVESAAASKLSLGMTNARTYRFW